MSALLRPDGRVVIVAVDHPLYSWPCPGLEDRAALLEEVAFAGADALIAAYGTVRDFRQVYAKAAAILKLDVTTVALGGFYPVSEYRIAWTVDDAASLGADAVLTFVQLGTDFELEALAAAGAVAGAADRAGLAYVCEIMPVESARFPDPVDPVAIAAACRTAAELGAHLIKTSKPEPTAAVGEAVRCGTPVVLAGGDRTTDEEGFLAAVTESVKAGAAGVAVGRNVWGSSDPGGMVRRLWSAVHEDTG